MRRINITKLREQAQKLIEKADQVEAEYFEELGRVFLNHLKRDKELKDVDTLKESAGKILKRLEY
jgi:predicted CDP-diglyceride synthetase/phosphatidate cytidylyltransferase